MVILLEDSIENCCFDTEPSILAGLDIAAIPRAKQNYKITTKAELRRYEKDSVSFV